MWNGDNGDHHDWTERAFRIIQDWSGRSVGSVHGESPVSQGTETAKKIRLLIKGVPSLFACLLSSWSQKVKNIKRRICTKHLQFESLAAAKPLVIRTSHLQKMQRFCLSDVCVYVHSAVSIFPYKNIVEVSCEFYAIWLHFARVNQNCQETRPWGLKASERN